MPLAKSHGKVQWTGLLF